MLRAGCVGSLELDPAARLLRRRRPYEAPLGCAAAEVLQASVGLGAGQGFAAVLVPANPRCGGKWLPWKPREVARG